MQSDANLVRSNTEHQNYPTNLSGIHSNASVPGYNPTPYNNYYQEITKSIPSTYSYQNYSVPVQSPNPNNPNPSLYPYTQSYQNLSNTELPPSNTANITPQNSEYFNQSISPEYPDGYIRIESSKFDQFYPQTTSENFQAYYHGAPKPNLGNYDKMQELGQSGNIVNVNEGEEACELKDNKNITPEENELMKNRLSATAQFSCYKYKMLKLSELIKTQATLSQFRKISINNFLLISDVDTIVETTSNGWIRIEVMKGFRKFNPAFVECINLLNSQYHISGWKKSRGDGNCYYRAVISRYFEIIFGVYSLTSNITFFLAILSKLKEFSEKKYNFDSDYTTALEHITYYTTEMKKKKEEDPYGTFEYLSYIFQNNEFDIKLVRVSRMLTFMGLITRASEYADYGMNVTENYSTMILTMGEEAEEFVLMLLPLELCIQVIQYNIFDKVHIEKFPDDLNKEIKVNIVRRAGHYDILYTKQDCEQDMFDFSNGTYHFLQSS